MNYRGMKNVGYLLILVSLAIIAFGVNYLNTSSPWSVAGDSPSNTPSQLMTMTTPPTLTATATETLTASPVPQPTQTQKPTATPTTQPTTRPTSTRSPEVQNGALLSPQEDGTLIFEDQNGDYKITFPSGWDVARINQDEFIHMTMDAALQDDAFQRQLLSIQQLDPNAFRVFAFDLSHKLPRNDQITFIEVRLDTQELMSVDQARNAYYQYLKSEYKLIAMIKNDMVRNSKDKRIGIVEAIIQGRAATGQVVNIYVKTAVITPHDRQQLRITLFSAEDFRYELSPVIDQIIESYEEFGD